MSQTPKTKFYDNVFSNTHAVKPFLWGHVREGKKIGCLRQVHTCDNLSMTMLEIWFSFPGDCVLLPGDCSTASLTYHFEVFFG